MAKNILFIVEGKRDESNLLISSFRRVLKLTDEDVVIHKYKSSIYSLYNRVKAGEYDSFLSFLYSLDKSIFSDKTVTPENTFSSVFLIFDLDPQSKEYNLANLIEMCNYFSDETRNGKIYLSVPMSQSIFDFTSYNQPAFNKRCYRIDRLSSSYKRESREASFLSAKYGTKAFRTIKIEDIYSVTLLNMKKYCYLLGRSFDGDWLFPFDSKEIVVAENDYIKSGCVSVLCGGILLIPDYSIFLLNELKKRKKE